MDLSLLGSLNNPPFLRYPTSIDAPGDYQPDRVIQDNVMLATLYHAVTHRNAYALRLSHIQYLQNLWFSQSLTCDSVISFLHLWNNFIDIIENAYDDRYFDTTLLPLDLKILSNEIHVTDTPAGAYIKYGQERLAVNINYRHGLNNISGLVHYGQICNSYGNIVQIIIIISMTKIITISIHSSEDASFLR